MEQAYYLIVVHAYLVDLCREFRELAVILHNRLIHRDPINVSEIDETVREILSGTPLTMNGLNDWVYIPF